MAGDRKPPSIYKPLRNEKAILAAARQYRRRAAYERELYRKVHDTISSSNETKAHWEAAKTERNAQGERVLMLIETGALK